MAERLRPSVSLMPTDPLYVEVRARQVRTGRPFFVLLSNLEGGAYHGFRSVYAYTAETKAAIEAKGSTADLAGVPVYSDTLFVDFDNTDPSPLLFHLYDEEIAHEVWLSGNRSVHVHIHVEPELGPHVPYSQRCWAEEYAPGCDLSFYHAAGQFRLPRTVHEKTGKRKTFDRASGRKRLEVPRATRAAPAVADVAPGFVHKGAFVQHLLTRKREGGRRVYAWHLAMQAFDEGVPFDVALQQILWWNSRNCSPPLESSVVVDRCQAVYRKRGGAL